MRRFLLALALAMSAVAIVPQLSGAASAHVERPSYWPDPTADCTVAPCAGGVIPKARSLASALDDSKPGRTRVVCSPNSLKLLDASIRKARKKGYYIRPSDHRPLTAKAAANLRAINVKLFEKCAYRQIQPAVTASRNNDRVVIMPGLYLEPRSRAQKTYDPKCAKYHTKSDSGDPGAMSHQAQILCPNDANLIAIIGRDAGKGVKADPDPPRENRLGVPNAGKCIRCNFQIEGSGVSADDVTIEAGSAKAGDGGPSAAGHKKDVGNTILPSCSKSTKPNQSVGLGNVLAEAELLAWRASSSPATRTAATTSAPGRSPRKSPVRRQPRPRRSRRSSRTARGH